MVWGAGCGSLCDMRFILYIYLKTSGMNMNWKCIVLYVIRVIELMLTGAAGGAAAQML